MFVIRKITVILLAGLCAASILAGCGNTDDNSSALSSSTVAQSNTTQYRLDGIAFQVGSDFTCMPASESSLMFLDQAQENYISVFNAPETSLEDAKKDIEDSILSSSDVECVYSEKEKINGVDGFHLKIDGKSDEVAKATNVFFFESKDNRSFGVIYSSESLNSDQADEKLKEIIATIEFES